MNSPDSHAAHSKSVQPKWHSLEPDEALEKLGSSRDGLGGDEASRRLTEYGPNQLPTEKRAGPIKRFLGQFNNVLIYILLAAAVGTAMLGIWLDTWVILAVVVINAIIGFIQEGKAEKAMEAIRDMLSLKALVHRDGQRRQIPAEDLVPGDIVHLNSGDRVPADLRLLETKNLRVEEAALTGESEPVEKHTAPADPQATIGDRLSMAFSGTLVSAGQARGMVVATGQHTELGKISSLVNEMEAVTTPLLRKVAQFGRWLSLVILVLAAGTFAVGYWVQDYSLRDIFLAAVSLAVAAIPEGLPAIMTVTLAIGVQGMARRNAIIRRLPAVETLGSVTVICSDKTGTLTRNEMTVTTVVTADTRIEVSGVGYEPRGGFTSNQRDVDPQEQDSVLNECLRAALLCNDAQLQRKDGKWMLDGEPTEGALVTAALKAGFDHRELNELYPRLDVIPFESDHKFMATLHHDHHGRGFIYLKGAPECVIDLCDRERTNRGDRPLEQARWKELMESIAGEGRRVLAVAMQDARADQRELDFDEVGKSGSGMVLLGLLGIIDPPREEAIAAVQECREAGIQVKMITGDHKLTAQAIAKELGIETRGGVIAGNELEEMDDEALRRAVTEVDVFARASPEHKLRLVGALQSQGQVVAMTGDGVNDAPALKKADVGTAMGLKGTEASKEASDMVLADDNFATIAHAVEAGRTVYDNLLKTILFILPTNGGQAFTIVAAIFLGVALPLSPVQVLWVNMVTTVTLAMALAFDPPEMGVMKRPPRDPDMPILSGFVIWRIVFVSVLLVGGTFGHFLWMLQQGADIVLSRTVAINTLVAGQVFYLFNSRRILDTSFRVSTLLGNRIALMAVGVLIVLQAAFTYLPPMQDLFGTTGMTRAEWGRVLIFGLMVFLVVELEKTILRWWRGRNA